MLARRLFVEALAGGAVLAPAASEAALATKRRPPARGFLPGFERRTVKTRGASINVLTGGSGPPLLLLHGYPQTHIEWRKIAPELARTHTVVLPDLRGYGDSSKPPGDADHANYSKRALAADQVELMEALGHRRFAMAAHDRGARVAHRLALDHPDRLSRLVLMDICPTLHMYETADRQFATAYFHWFFLIQPSPFPETLIGASADAFLRYVFGRGVGGYIESAAYAEYLRCFADPAAIHGSCEDYRAAASIDLVHDKADRGRRIECPVRVLWGAQGLVGAKYDVLGVWRDYASEVSGAAIGSSHWLAEEAPQETLGEIRAFLGG